EDGGPEELIPPELPHGRQFSLRCLYRRDDLEQAWPFLASCFDQIRAGHCRLHRRRGHQVGARHAAQVVRGDLQEALLETLTRLPREAGGAVGRLAPSLD